MGTYNQKKVDLVYQGKPYRLISKANRTPRSPTPPEKERKRSSNEALKEDEVRALIQAADDLFDRTILIVGFNSGMRVSEITNIETGRIDYDNARINVWDEKKNRDRNVYVGDASMAAIKLYIKERAVKGMKLFEYSDKSFERHLQKLTTRVLGHKRSWHTLRHTYVTLCAKRGVDIKVVCENTGDSPETILKVYNNPSKETMQESANLVLGDMKDEV